VGQRGRVGRHLQSVVGRVVCARNFGLLVRPKIELARTVSGRNFGLLQTVCSFGAVSVQFVRPNSRKLHTNCIKLAQLALVFGAHARKECKWRKR